MDYSKVKYVKPSVDGISSSTGTVYITKGKVYKIKGKVYLKGLCSIINDLKFESTIIIRKCAHIGFNHWIPCDKDGTPL